MTLKSISHTPPATRLKILKANVHPREYSYDNDGRLKTLITWRDHGANGDGTDADATSRSSQPGITMPMASFCHKLMNWGAIIILDYDNLGRLDTRTDARGISKDFHYDHAGRITGVTYNDAGTHGIDYTYNSRGQLDTVEDAAGTRTMNYSAATGRYQGTTWTAGTFNGLTQDYHFDNLGRLRLLNGPLAVITAQLTMSTTTLVALKMLKPIITLTAMVIWQMPLIPSKKLISSMVLTVS